MELLYLLEKIRLPVLNELMLLITTLGDEVAFLVVALIMFWCLDKRRGYYMMAVGFMGSILNQFLKLACRVPRPWLMDENFTIVEQAQEGAGGYSFPSGHTTLAVGTFGSVAITEKRLWMRITSVVLAVLVAFSRMYLGVHTPLDIFGGALIALVLVFALRPVFFCKSELARYILLGIIALVGIVFFLYTEFYPFPADIDPDNLASAVKNAYTMLGCLMGMIVVYIVESKWIRFSVDAVWWAQALKVLSGLIVVLFVLYGLKSPLEALFGGHMASRALRYFLTVITAGLLWPMTFRFWSKLGKKCVA